MYINVMNVDKTMPFAPVITISIGGTMTDILLGGVQARNRTRAGSPTVGQDHLVCYLEHLVREFVLIILVVFKVCMYTHIDIITTYNYYI